MKRREFITLIGGAAATWPLATRAQQPAMPVLGVLGIDPQFLRSASFRSFHQGLADAGFAEGRNVAIEYRWSEGRIERFPDMVADLLRRPLAAITSLGGIPGAAAAKAATATVPIVFTGAFDPVEIGLVASLARPGGNLTGVSSLSLELSPKRLEVMHELMPGAKVFALLVNPDHPNAEIILREMPAAARALGLQVRTVPVRAVSEFDTAFASLATLGAEGLMIVSGQPFVGRPGQLGELAARHKTPAIFGSREFVDAGGLASYGGNNLEINRLAGFYTGRVLKGEKPADLPVQQVTKIELIVNMKAARALGITVPISLLGRADEVIE